MAIKQIVAELDGVRQYVNVETTELKIIFDVFRPAVGQLLSQE